MRCYALAQEQEIESDAAMLASSRLTDSASQPWSKSWPSGELLRVRRACLPSRQSRCTYATTENADSRYVQRGASPFGVLCG